MYYDLSQDLDHYLGTVLAATRQEDDGTVAELARAELPQLVGAVRALLRQHQPDHRHRCPTCHGRRWFFWRRPNMPCRAYLAAHRRLVVLPENRPEFDRSEDGQRAATPSGSNSLGERNTIGERVRAENCPARHSRIDRIGAPLRSAQPSISR